MDISIIVVTYNEEDNIHECLSSLIVQEYTLGNLEIIVVDGMSEDRTQEIVEGFVQTHEQVRLIPNPGRTIASNRNKGLQHAAYPYIAFTDADCTCPKDWIQRLSEGFQSIKHADDQTVAVGGGNTPSAHAHPFIKAVGVAFDTPFSALGSVQTRLHTNLQKVSSLACLNVLYDKHALLQVDGFDESLKNMGEDWDMNYRLRKLGYSLYFLPDAPVFHKMRARLSDFIKQMFQYGVGRGKLLRGNLQTAAFKYILPLIFPLLFCISLLVYAAMQNVFLLLPFLYFPCIVLYSTWICIRKKQFGLILKVTIIFYTIHFAYSLGEWTGVLAGRKTS